MSKDEYRKVLGRKEHVEFRNLILELKFKEQKIIRVRTKYSFV